MKKWWMEILTFQFSSILFYTHLSAISWEAKRLRCVNRIYSRNCWEQRSNLSYIVYTNDRTDDSIPILYENILTRLTKSEESHRFCESHRFLRIIFFSNNHNDILLFVMKYGVITRRILLLDLVSSIFFFFKIVIWKRWDVTFSSSIAIDVS